MSAYNNIHCFVEIHNNAVFVEDGNSRYGAFRKHMHNIKNGRIHACCGNGIIWILAWRNLCGDIGSDLEFPQRELKLLYFLVAL